MNISDYYEIDTSEERVIHVIYHGFWAGNDAEEVARTALSMWQQAVDDQGGRKFIVISDFLDMDVLSDWTKRYLVQKIKYAKARNLHMAVQVGAAAIAKMGTREVVNQVSASETQTVVSSMAEAREIVADLKRELDED